MDAAVGEDRVGAGHVEGRGVVGADGDRGRAASGLDAGFAGEGGDAIEADHGGEADGGVVERPLQGVARR